MFKRTLAAIVLVSCASLACAAPVARADTHAGTATFFNQAGAGACGVTNSDQDLVVAVSSQFFHSFGAQTVGNPICGRNIKATTSAGKSVTAAVEDICETCGADDLNMSTAAFKQITDESGAQQVTWVLL